MATTAVPYTLGATYTVIEQPILKAALDKLSKFVARNSTLPVLSTVLVDAYPGYLELTATNLDIALRVRLHTQGNGDFKTAVPFKALREAVSRISGVVSLTLEKKEITRVHEAGQHVGTGQFERTLIIDKTGGQVKIKHALDSEEFPNIAQYFEPQAAQAHLFDLPSDVFAKEIKRVVCYAASDEARPVFTSVFIEIERGGAGTVRFIAADSYRLGWSDIAVQNCIDIPERLFWNDKPTDLLPSAASLETLAGVLPKKATNLRFDLLNFPSALESGWMAVYWNGENEPGNPNYAFLTRLIDGQYPPYQRVLAKDLPVHTLVMEADDLLRGLDAFGKEIFKDDHNQIVTCSLVDGGTQFKMVVSNEDTEQTEYVKMEMSRDESDEQDYIRLNWQYMQDACKAFAGGTFVLRLWKPQQPVEFRALDTDSDTHVCIVMPLHKIK